MFSKILVPILAVKFISENCGCFALLLRHTKSILIQVYEQAVLSVYLSGLSSAKRNFLTINIWARFRKSALPPNSPIEWAQRLILPSCEKWVFRWQLNRFFDGSHWPYLNSISVSHWNRCSCLRLYGFFAHLCRAILELLVSRAVKGKALGNPLSLLHFPL